MRNGRLLVEENPASLMERFNSEILEDIVVKLCRSQDMENSSYPSLEGGGSNCQIIDDEAVCVSYKSKCEEVSQGHDNAKILIYPLIQSDTVCKKIQFFNYRCTKEARAKKEKWQYKLGVSPT